MRMSLFVALASMVIICSCSTGPKASYYGEQNAETYFEITQSRYLPYKFKLTKDRSAALESLQSTRALFLGKDVDDQIYEMGTRVNPISDGSSMGDAIISLEKTISGTQREFKYSPFGRPIIPQIPFRSHWCSKHHEDSNRNRFNLIGEFACRSVARRKWSFVQETEKTIEAMQAYSYAGPARYEFASDLLDLTEFVYPTMNVSEFFEAGLGAPILEEAYRRLTSKELALSENGARGISFESVDEISFHSGKITIGSIALKKLIIYHYLSYPNSIPNPNDCFSKDDQRTVVQSVFCLNLAVRLEKRGQPKFFNKKTAKLLNFTFTDSGPPSARLIETAAVGQRISGWSKTYGRSYVDAYFEEVWNFMRAQSEIAERQPGCYESNPELREAPFEIECSAETSEVSIQLRASFLPIWASMELVMAHEEAHFLLGHSRHSLVELVQSGWSECDARQILETEADILGSLILAYDHGYLLSYGSNIFRVVDFFGFPSTTTKHPVGFEQLLIHNGLIQQFKPFFHGYAWEKEGTTASCSYLNSASRLPLFYLNYAKALSRYQNPEINKRLRDQAGFSF